MESETYAEAGPISDDGPSSGPKPSFHGRLLTRRLPDPRRASPLARIARKSRWIGPACRGVGAGAIFVGGMGVGAGLMALGRGDGLRGQAGAVMILGLASLLLAILASLAAREAARGWGSMARD